VATGSGTLDILLGAIKARQQEREALEARLAELDDEARAVREAASEVERLRSAWKNWGGALDAEPVLARQLLKRVISGTIAVTPAEGGWGYQGHGDFDGLLAGAIGADETVTIHRGIRPRPRPISGGSDATVGVNRQGHVEAPM
jgi:hypothetical protein